MSEYAPGPAGPPNNQMALTSLISGIIAWVMWGFFLCFNFFFSWMTLGVTTLCGLVPVIPWGIAVVTGHMGLSQIGRTAEGGKGMAIAGMVMGYVGLALTACAVMVVVAAAVVLLISSAQSGPPPTP
jgi:hypothetical protein